MADELSGGQGTPNPATDNQPKNEEGAAPADGGGETILTEGVEPQGEGGEATPEEGKAPESDDKGATPEGDDSSAEKDEADEGDESSTGDDNEPEAYEPFKMPEGIDIDEALVSKATPIMRELGLDQEQAQKAVDFIAQMRADDQAAIVDRWSKTQESWLSEIRNDPNFGGADSEKNLKAARDFIKNYATEDDLGGYDLRRVLNETGMGNHPAFVRLFKKLSEDLPLGEDEQKPSGGPIRKSPTDKPRHERMYGKKSS